MGWSQELNDFSEGFSSGFNMVRSRDEREADKLALERSRQEVEQHQYDISRRPVKEGREQQLHDLDVRYKEGTIDQQEYERSRRAIEAGQADTLFELGAERERGTLEQQGYERGQRPVKEGREQKLFDLEVQRQEGVIDQQEYEKSRRDIIAGQEDTLFELDVEGKKEIISGGKEDTRGKKLANDKLQKQQDLFDAYQKRRGGRKTLKDEDEVPAATTPGPTSSREPAVEVPVESTATHDEPPPMADEGSFERQRAVERSPRMFGGPVTEDAADYALPVPPGGRPEIVESARPIVEEPVPAEAVPAEPVAPVTPATPAYGVPLPAGGPRAHPHVDRIQRSRAEQENTAAQPRLDDATVNVLEAAGAQTNTRAVITSGGTGGEPAQVRLYDMETNQPLDPNNPDDRQRMEAFNAAVQSAPARTTSPLDRTGSVYKTAREATMAGLDHAADKHGLKNQSAVDTPETEQAAYSFLSGDYGADADQVEQAKAVVQEMAAEAGHELNEAEEAIYTVAFAYDSYMAAGMYDEAKEAAAAVVGHYTKLAGQFSAVAKAAVADGDLPAGIEAAARAYANVPDGVGVDFNQTADGRYEVVMTNEETGEVTTRSIMTPDEIGGMIMKIDPSHFLSTMAQAAGKDLAETLSPEAAEQMGKPEWAGIPMTQVPAMQAQERIYLRRGGAVEVTSEDGAVSVDAGKPAKGPTPDQQTEIVTGVTQGFERFAANVAASNKGEGPESDLYTAQLSPESASDLLMDIRPVTEQIAVDNYGTHRPDVVVEAVTRMIGQEPAAAKAISGDRIQISMRGIAPFTMSSADYARLSDARIKYGPPPSNEPPSQEQVRRDMGTIPFLPDYDPTRYPVGEVVGGEAVPAVPAAVAPSIYAPRAPAVYDPNLPNPLWEGAKRGWEELTAVPTSPTPTYNPSGRRDYVPSPSKTAKPSSRPSGHAPIVRDEEYAKPRAKPKLAKPNRGSKGGGRGGSRLEKRI